MTKEKCSFTLEKYNYEKMLENTGRFGFRSQSDYLNFLLREIQFNKEEFLKIIIKDKRREITALESLLGEIQETLIDTKPKIEKLVKQAHQNPMF